MFGDPSAFGLGMTGSIWKKIHKVKQ